MDTKENKKASKTKELTFEEKFKAFKAGKGEAPVLYKDFNFTINDANKTVVISREEQDRDGECVMMDGMILRSWIKKTGLPMIDSHNMYESIGNVLGAVRNLRVEEVGGKKSLIGEPDFAPTDRGNEAKILYMGVNGGKPYATNVSMGFAVYDYDNETKQILEWEPFEASLVLVGANMSARFMDQKDLELDDAKKKDIEEQMAKDLARFKQIHEPFKEVCKLLLSDTLFKKMGLEKDGDLLVDINSLYDCINQKFSEVKEAPQLPVEAPQEPQKIDVSKHLIDEFETIFTKLGS